MGRLVSSLISPVGAGLALVQIMRASQSFISSSIADVSALVMSQMTTLSGGICVASLSAPIPAVPASSACRDSSERTVPIGA